MGQDIDINPIVIGTTRGATFPVTSQGKNVNALMDSGAGRSCMSLEMYLQLDLPDIEPRHLSVVAAQGGSLEPMGLVDCKFDINGKPFDAEFIVCRKLRRPMVLGLDWWRQNAIGFMCTKRKTRKLLCGEDVLIKVDDHDQPGIPIALNKTLRIPARSFMVAAVDCDTTVTGDKTFHLSPYLADEEPNLINISTSMQNMEDMQGKLICHFANLQLTPICLSKETVIGYLRDDIDPQNVDIIDINDIDDSVEEAFFNPSSSLIK